MNNKRRSADGKPRIVLVIRGELLKRYPDTIIYAQQARWGDAPKHQNHLTLYDESGKAGHRQRRPTLTFDTRCSGPRWSRTSISSVSTCCSTRCAATPRWRRRPPPRLASIPTRLGWFFVLQEVVGEPRFGLDEHAVTTSEAPLAWDSLSWENLGTKVQIIKPGTPFATESAECHENRRREVEQPRRRHGLHPLSEAGARRDPRSRHAQGREGAEGAGIGSAHD